MKKGQAAMEFLMTYGWAILVVLVAIGALAYFGVLSPEKYLTEKCTISTGSGLFCDDFSIDSSSTVRLNVKNILSDGVTNVTVTLTNTGGGTGSCTNAAGVDVAADTEGVVTLACDPVLSTKVKGDLVVAYSAGGFAKKTTGSVSGSVP